MSHVVEIDALRTKTSFNETNTVVPPPLLLLEATSVNHWWGSPVVPMYFRFLNETFGSIINIGCHEPNITAITPVGGSQIDSKKHKNKSKSDTEKGRK